MSTKVLPLLLILVVCLVSTVSSESLDKANTHKSLDKQERAEIEGAVAFFQEVGQSIKNFGTRIKNFFTHKSNRPIPRPIDHTPVMAQEQQDSEGATLKQAVIESTFLELIRKKKQESREKEESSWLWWLLAKAFRQ